jgi:rhamnosyl/mannosyltransferase
LSGPRLRILHVYKDYWPVVGGIENHVRVLAESQAAAGNAVTVLVTDPGPRTRRGRENGVAVVRAGRLGSVSSAPVSVALVREMRRQRPDVTHLHVPYPIGEGAWLAAGRRPMVVTYHSDIVRQRLLGRLWAPLLGLVLRRADRVIATSTNYVESSEQLRKVRSKVVVVPLGIDPRRFTMARAEPDAQGGVGSAESGSTERFRSAATREARQVDLPTVLFVGRLRYYKGLGVLLEALTRLPARLRVVGTGSMAATWQAKAHELGVADRVEWLGDVSDDDLPQVLSAADVFALPAIARSEAFGVAILEAMAAGLPVVTTELSTGTSFVVADGVTGRVIPPGDPKALAIAIAGLLDDPALARRMGEAGRQRVFDHFTEERMVNAVASVYSEVVGA